MVENNILVHELQLGPKLSQCVHSNRRADFGLMLAMLTDDVREHSQFHLPHKDIEEPIHSDSKYRRLFNLPEQAPLALNHESDISLFNQAELIGKNLPTVQLQNKLTPKALAFRDDCYHVPTSIKTNTSLSCQQRLQQKQPLNKRTDFNAKLWLATIQDSIVKSLIA